MNYSHPCSLFMLSARKVASCY